jgi:hypothetical protein
VEGEGAAPALLVPVGKKGSGAWDLRDDDTHDEGEQWELREVNTGDEMLQAPAMTQRRRSTGDDACAREERCRRGERTCTGARPRLLKEQGREREQRPG